MPNLTAESLKIPKTIKLYINGNFPRTESGRSYPIKGFESEKIYAHLCRASRKDVRMAVEAAKKMQTSWMGKTAYNRGQILYRMAEMTESKRLEILEVLQGVQGHTLPEAQKQVDEAIDALVYFAGFADKFQQVLGAVNPVSGPHHNFTTPEPVGVVGLVCEENMNLKNIFAAVAAIIVSGNTLVTLLPGTSGALLAPLGEIFATSDVPNGVINLLSGHTDELRDPLSSHMEVNSLALIKGSDNQIKEWQSLSVPNMKRFVGSYEPKLNLEGLTPFLEFKTVWHPIGY